MRSDEVTHFLAQRNTDILYSLPAELFAGQLPLSFMAADCTKQSLLFEQWIRGGVSLSLVHGDTDIPVYHADNAKAGWAVTATMSPFLSNSLAIRVADADVVREITSNWFKFPKSANT